MFTPKSKTKSSNNGDKSNNRKKPARIKSLLVITGSVVLVLVSVWLVSNKQFVIDTTTALTYNPSDSIAEIVSRAGYTEKGKLYFYASRPAIQDSDNFNESCPRIEEGNPILGCYSTSGRIYVYNVTDEDLDGIEDVTATHEMLHAVWARLSQDERTELTAELKTEYEAVASDSLKTRMEYYERNEPDQFYNEIHSILGTEVANLSTELEDYYSEYFDRSAVLNLYENYNSTYDDLHSRASELEESMSTLATSINEEKEAYDADLLSYTEDVTDFNTRANNGSFTSQEQFNSERSALVARESQLDEQREAINADIETYNSYYTEYQSISDKIQGLNNSIDSMDDVEAPSSI